MAATVHTRQVGLGGRLNPNCIMWTAAIEQFGKGSLMGKALSAVEGAQKVFYNIHLVILRGIVQCCAAVPGL